MLADRFTNRAIRYLAYFGLNQWRNGLGVPDGHRGFRRASTLSKKFFLLMRWAMSIICFYRERNYALDSLKMSRAQQTTFLHETCLILGSGEISGNNTIKVRKLALNPNVTIMVMNHFDQTQLFASIKIDYWLMLDRGAQQDNSNYKTSKTWEMIGSMDECTVVVPWQDFKTTKHVKKVAVENHSLAGVTKNISPLWPRGYEGKSCLKAICLADYLGFGEIVVAGCSNDYYKHATVTNGYVDADEVKEFSPMSAEDYFQNIANEFAYQRMVLSKIKSKFTFLS